MNNLNIVYSQAVQSGTQAHQKAMVTRLGSFEQSMTIKLRALEESELSEAGAAGPSGGPEDDNQSEITRKTGKTGISRFTRFTQFTQLTQKARQFKTQMLRVFRKNHELEDSDIVQMQ
ncbi:unnamed protein product [Rhizoctonia solani]|uniref:Uncharacterized protein n=1 Tax=Rhizoctonia solani TaxID=456999 RepID=A0A8H2WLL8_9AGAM|nr:unnamed protein product [Rhizoctonia solani]